MTVQAVMKETENEIGTKKTSYELTLTVQAAPDHPKLGLECEETSF